MRPTSIKSITYSPDLVPTDVAELNRFLTRQLLEISTAIGKLADGHLDVQYVAPTKPRDGDVRYADGTSWNPGSGRGAYLYKINTWVLLG